MGCTPSKQVKAGVADVYRPLPSSFAVFDINAIEEPWLKPEQLQAPPQHDDEKPTRNARAAAAAAVVLEKLDAITEAPRSWDEVSKALETHLKSPASAVNGETKTTVKKSSSFHTVEELEAKTKTDDHQKPVQKLRKTESDTRAESRNEFDQPATGFRPVKENIFVVRDRQQRERREGGSKRPEAKRDPLSEFPERCPPGGAKGVVVYTTSLRGVRRTYEDCVRVKGIMEQLGVVFDERDVALDAGIRSELRQLLGDAVTPEEVGPPRVFVKGRYVGGAAEVVGMNETGKLGRVMKWARVESVGEEGRLTCDGCGGVRWLPCLDCGGSRKVVPAETAETVEGWERCGKCNENGLVRCPLCFTL